MTAGRSGDAGGCSEGIGLLPRGWIGLGFPCHGASTSRREQVGTVEESMRVFKIKTIEINHTDSSGDHPQ